MITSPYNFRVSLLATFIVSCKNYEVVVEKTRFFCDGSIFGKSLVGQSKSYATV